eukprot:gb/GECG01003944.1/.p1 GENE.gb/GECG01003944.1/~~gb/GECG01003944.1/.p1  ORF type:complete len:219 (+),score=31.39 gb/GECG01003944.1/:1-657(+)
MMDVEYFTVQIPAVEAEILSTEEDSQGEGSSEDDRSPSEDGDLTAMEERCRFHEVQLSFESLKQRALHNEQEHINLKRVGEQLWNGAVFACDWVLENGSSALLANKTLVELGSGIGLLSFICRLYAHKVVCTDKEQDVVALAQRNTRERNEHVGSSFSLAPIEFYCFDWEQPDTMLSLESSTKCDAWSFLREQSNLAFIARYVILSTSTGVIHLKYHG